MLLDVKNLSVFLKNVTGKPSVVEQLSFTVNEGECVGIVGESGSGKSMTAKVVMGLLKGLPVECSGEVWLSGKNILKMSERDLSWVRGKEISMIFQEPMTALNPVLSVFDQVAEPLRVHFPEKSKLQIESEVSGVLERVGLTLGSEVKRVYPHELSGGMRQRVLIAMSIIAGPKLLIADEPTTALDVTVQAQILNLLKSLQKDLGMAVLLISHDLAVISEMTSQLYVMYAGRVVEEGETRCVLRDRLHPYTEGLFKSIPDLKGNRTRLQSMEGSLPPPGALPLGCAFSDRCPKKVEKCSQASPPLEKKRNGQRASCFEVS